MADIRLQDVVKIYGVSKNQKKHRQLFFKKEKTNQRYKSLRRGESHGT